LFIVMVLVGVGGILTVFEEPEEMEELAEL
jgi:hypothetical protein